MQLAFLQDFVSQLSDRLSAVPAWALVLLVLAIVLSLQKVTALQFGKLTQPAPFLEADKWKQLPLVDKVILNHNTRRFRFALPSSRQKPGLPVGKHIALRAFSDGEQIIKPYTPVSDEQQHIGFIDFVIKVYPEGRMSQYLDKLAIGDSIDFKGPRGRFEYSPNMKRAIGMLAGGTGITPMYQVARAVLQDPKDTTNFSLIFGNLTEDDILIRDLLDDLARQHPDRFSVFYVLNAASDGWLGGVGFVTEDIIKEHLPAPAQDVLVVQCGPPAMNKAMRAALDALGYTREMQFEF